jgi:hypothetical protein
MLFFHINIKKTPPVLSVTDAWGKLLKFRGEI